MTKRLLQRKTVKTQQMTNPQLLTKERETPETQEKMTQEPS
jgi:hypothetical protein